MPLTSLIVWLLLIGLPTTLQAGSARMEPAISPDRPAQAEYWPGAVDRPAILIGHGSGGVQLAVLLKAHPDLAVDRLLLVSPSYLGEEQAADRFSAIRKRAVDALRRSDNALDVYALQFCNAYNTTAAAYGEWGRERMQQIAAEGRMPATVIFGDQDKDIDRDWLAALRDTGVRVHAVAGATRLLVLANASDLYDRVLYVIAGSRHG